jgi:LemA protein
MDVSLRRILGVLYPVKREPKASKKMKRKGKRGLTFSWGRFFFVIFVALLIIKLTLFFFYYNSFLSMQYDVDEAAAQVDTQLQRRRDIILNLNIIVTDYSAHENRLFRYAADSRKEMVKPPPIPPQKVPTGEGGGAARPAGLQDLLSRIFAIAERYPDLRLSENFQRYMDALIEVESEIATRRMAYNVRANVMSTAVGKFPGFVFAELYGFEPPPFYQPDDDARTTPRVESTRAIPLRRTR